MRRNPCQKKMIIIQYYCKKQSHRNKQQYDSERKSLGALAYGSASMGNTGNGIASHVLERNDVSKINHSFPYKGRSFIFRTDIPVFFKMDCMRKDAKG